MEQISDDSLIGESLKTRASGTSVEFAAGFSDVVLGSGDCSFDISDELRRNYVKRRLGDLSDVEQALKHQDFDSLKNVGHKIRGNAASFAYPELEKIAIDLEEAAENLDFLRAFELGRDFRKWLLGEMCRPWFIQKAADL